MHPADLFLIVAVTVLIVDAIVIATAATWNEAKWKAEYDRKWFIENRYCVQCGSLLNWLNKDKVRYDPSSGLAYIAQVWGCPGGHTHFDLIERCQRRTYLNATAQED